MTWHGRRVLVTGAGGFIGSHVVEALAEQGADVTAFLHYRREAPLGALVHLSADVMEHVRPVYADVRDPEAVLTACEDQDVVFHLAASISVAYSLVHPRDVVETNVIGTYNILAAARRCRPSRLVVASSSEVYGTAQHVPIGEDHPLVGQSPYAASKIAAEKLSQSFHRAYGVPVVVVRPFNTYGPRQSTRAVIPSLLSQALAGGPVRLGDIRPRRDFVYVEDTARGIVAAAASEGAVGNVVNLGTGTDVAIADLIPMVEGILGRRLDIEHDKGRDRPPNSEVMRLLADSGRARAVLGWQAHTSLQEGLRHTARWLAQHPISVSPLDPP